MGTRSTISMLNKEGEVLSAYCHWDGYLSHNGKILQEHYSSAQKVKELLSFGQISSLGEAVSPSNGVKHSFDERVEGVTVFYGRDRGETGVESVKYKSLSMYMKNGDFQEYDYLFSEHSKKWYLYHSEKKLFESLTMALKHDGDEGYKPILFSLEEEIARKEVKKLEKAIEKKPKTKGITKV